MSLWFARYPKTPGYGDRFESKRRNTRSEQIESALPRKAEIGILLKVRFAPKAAVPQPLLRADKPR
jgi:hypothetical protein